jgi:hypothetical protein
MDQTIEVDQTTGINWRDQEELWMAVINYLHAKREWLPLGDDDYFRLTNEGREVLGGIIYVLNQLQGRLLFFHSTGELWDNETVYKRCQEETELREGKR